MKDLEQHKKIAVLIDADNAQLTKLPLIIEELSSHGHVVVKRAYGDWSIDSLKNWKTVLNELAIQPIQQFAYTKGKNATDASMIIDAMDLLYSSKFDAFALVSKISISLAGSAALARLGRERDLSRPRACEGAVGRRRGAVGRRRGAQPDPSKTVPPGTWIFSLETSGIALTSLGRRSALRGYHT